MPVYITHVRKQPSRAHQKQGRADMQPASAIMIEAVLKSVSKARQNETQTYGGFQPHESFMLGPSPDRELCMEISPDGYRQGESLNDLRSDFWQGPDAHVNARECAARVNQLFTVILTPAFVRCTVKFHTFYPSSPLFDSERMGWMLERPLFRSYVEHVAAFKMAQTPTPKCSQETGCCNSEHLSMSFDGNEADAQ